MSTTKNLTEQLDKLYRIDTEKGFKTKGRYYSAELGFIEFLGEQYGLNKLSNVCSKHVRAYVEHMRNGGLADNTVRTVLSGIRHYHTLTGSKNILPDNRKLCFGKRQVGVINRAWSENEVAKAIQKADEQGETRISIAIKISSQFGLRLEEVSKIRARQIYDADKFGVLVTRGKGGKERSIPVETPEQKALIDKLCTALKNKGLKRDEYVIADGDVRKTKQYISKWIEKNRDGFTDKVRTAGEGEKPKTDKLTFHGLRYFYAQNAENRLKKKNSDYYAKKKVSVNLGHERHGITNTYLAKKKEK